MQKGFIILSIIFGLFGITSAEQKTLFSYEKSGLGGYGGPHFRFGSIEGNSVVSGFGAYMTMITPSFGIGLSAVYPEKAPDDMNFFYTGALFQYHFLQNLPIRLIVGTTLGGGQVSYTPDQGATLYRSGMFMIEPEVSLQINFCDSFALNFGVTYSIAAGIKNLPVYDNASLSGFSFLLSLRDGIISGPVLFENWDSRKVSVTGIYTVCFTQLAGQYMMMDGGGTALLLNQKGYIGIGGRFSKDDTAKINGYDVSAMEIGLILEYIFNPDSLVEFSVGGITGVFFAGYMDPDTDEMVGGPAFTIDPEFYASLHVNEFTQLRIGAGYRLAIPFQSDGLFSVGELSGPTATFEWRMSAF